MQGNRRRKRKIGVVVSDSMDKSRTVLVERTVLEPRFKKYVRRRKKFMVHDEKNESHKGDMVSICECRPLSKRKRWRLEGIIEKASELPGV